MAEYIEREEVMSQIDAADFVIDNNFAGGATLLFCDDVVGRLSAIPAADVRPVVRNEKKILDVTCPLVLVPPHGRLIAEDDAIKTAWMILEGLGYRKEENKQLEQTVREVFATAPAIEVE